LLAEVERLRAREKKLQGIVAEALRQGFDFDDPDGLYGEFVADFEIRDSPTEADHE